MDPLNIFWPLYLSYYLFSISNCGEIEQPKNKLEIPSNEEGIRKNHNSAESVNPSVEKSGDSTRGKNSNTMKRRTKYHKINLKDDLENAKTFSRQGKSILGPPPIEFQEKQLNEAKLQAKLRAISNAATIDREMNSKLNEDKLKTKKLEKTLKRNTDKSYDTKNNTNEKKNNNADIRIYGKTTDKATRQTSILSSAPSKSHSTGNGRSSVKLNPNADTFQPKTNFESVLPNVIAIVPKNSSSSRELSLNPNAPTFRPKIYPLLVEMSILSKQMRTRDSNFPLFELKTKFTEVLIVTYDCLHTRADANITDDPSVLNSIRIFEKSTRKLIYEAHPKLGKIQDLRSYLNADIIDEAGPQTRKDEETIGKEISEIVNGRIIVGINLGKIIHKFKVRTKPFNVREITTLSKYADIFNTRNNADRKDSYWFRNHKALLGTFLPEMKEEMKSIAMLRAVDKRKYISILFAKLRQEWESEVNFLKQMYWYYKDKLEIESKEILGQFGAIYPGLHCGFIVDKAPALPKELVGLHIRYDKWNKVIKSIAAIDSKLDRIFKAFVRNEENIRIDSTGSVIVGRLEPIVNYILQRNFLNRDTMIVGFGVYETAQILDWERKLKGAKIYDTKIIFDAESVTELAAKYLKIDFRYKFLEYFPKNKEEERESFQGCDIRIPIEFAAKISMQMFRLYALDKHRKVEALKLWE